MGVIDEERDLELTRKKEDGNFIKYNPITKVENVIGAETPTGAQAKADTAETNAKAYTDLHEQKAAPHSGHETPAGAQAKADAAEAAAKVYTDSAFGDLAGTGRTTETVKGNADSIASVQTNLQNHIDNTNNPHGVTTAQIGAVSQTEFNSHLNDNTAHGLSNLIQIDTGIVLLSANWVDDTATSGYWIYDVSDVEVEANTVVDVNVHLTSLEAASSLKPVTQSFSGYYRLYAEEKPTADIIMDVRKTRQVV